MAAAKLSYVPEPKPATSDYLIGAFYFPYWKTGAPGVPGWGLIKDYPERTPLLGYYDENAPEVADWEIKWALEHGINYWVYCWYRGSSNVGKPPTPENIYLGHAIHEGLFNARYGDMFKFTIMWENACGGGAESVDDLMENLLPFWIENYFSRPNYLKLDNKPVLFIYSLFWTPGNLKKDFGSIENIRKVLDQMRDACRKAGFDGLHLMCEMRWQDISKMQEVKDCGFDHMFSYCWNTPQQFPTGQEAIQVQQDYMNGWREAGVMPHILTATVAWDPKPRTPPDQLDKIARWKLRPEEWRTVLEILKDAMAKLPKGSLGRRMLLLDNWNEWDEGHYISPHVDGGFGYLQAVREVLTQADNKPDYRLPQDIGLGPYDSLYQKSLKEKKKA